MTAATSTPINPCTDQEDPDTSFHQRMAHQHSQALIQELFNSPQDPDWQGDCMTTRYPTTGLRVAMQNVDKKLHGSNHARLGFIGTMRKWQIDIAVAFEPGRSSEPNQAAILGCAIKHQSKVILTSRGPATNCGGIVVWLDTKWAQVPHVIHRFDNKTLQDRVLIIEFNNAKPGDHNKLLLIAYYGLNSAHTNPAKAQRELLHTWIRAQTHKFKQRNPLASVVLVGDTNAAKTADLDTDREPRGALAPDTKEADACVIEDLESMHLIDVIREKHPTTRVVTRKNAADTHRYLDRIMASQEAATHTATRAGTSSNLDLIPGSKEPDHKTVIADLPIDTAGAAQASAGLWEKHTETRWVKDQDDKGIVSKAKTAAYNNRLDQTSPAGTTYAHAEKYYLDAAKGTTLKKITTHFPLRIQTIKHMKKLDYKLRHNIKPLRRALYQIDREHRHPIAVITKQLKQISPQQHTPLTPDLLATIQTAATGGRVATVQALNQAINLAEKYLSRKERKERQSQIHTNIKKRNERFSCPQKKQLSRVISSIMKRMAVSEEISRIDTETGQPLSEATQVAEGVVKFYQNWFSQRSAPTHRWQTEDDMMHLRTDKLNDPKFVEFVETAYRESYDKFNHLQHIEGIWDSCSHKITMEELIRTIKTTKAATAGGPSGLTYDILKDTNTEHLAPLLEILQTCMTNKAIPPEMNRTRLRPIPKTEAGLSDLSLTRPIALMEVALKLFEKILFTRIMRVITTNSMLREEQYGSLPNRTVADPIRALAETIEDAAVSGKELHVFSADLTRAFDSIEYWSQAMSWRALGMPKDLVGLLVGMDEGGSTEVIMGQGRTTATVLKDKGWFTNGRGVRQGSIGGPIKWVVFMNFWLEYIHKKHKGQGYQMSTQSSETLDRDTPGELLGQMFVDDSNWITSSVHHMTEVVASCSTFVEFHTLSFNRKKCEYMAVNQSEDPTQLDPFQRPTWPDGHQLIEKLRKPTDSKTWQRDKEEARSSLRATEDCVLLEPDKPVRVQPSKEDYDMAKNELYRLAHTTDTPAYPQQKQTAIDKIAQIRAVIYGTTALEALPGVNLLMAQWEEGRDRFAVYDRTGNGETMRYLGVHFQAEPGWQAQRAILEKKFAKLKDTISRSCPTREQAIYCVNAVINATMKFPLQVASIPRTTLERWDTANRETIRAAGKLPKLPPWMFHRPKPEGGLGLESLAESVGSTQAGHQMRLLNSDSAVGRIVRDAEARHRAHPDPPWTIQANAQAYTREHGMRVEKVTTNDLFGTESKNYTDTQEQAELDMETAHANMQGPSRESWTAYGDGATWFDDQKSGWGVCMHRKGDAQHPHYEIERCGRLQAAQDNSAAEAMAILQAMLHIHPTHNLTVHSDNQGCVDKMAHIETADPAQWQNRVIWLRIHNLAKYRALMGATTSTHWVHSHVDDPERRATPKAAHLCVCKQQREDDCDPEHRAHLGNERADDLAKNGADMPRTEEWSHRAQGELQYIIRKGPEVAHGPYSEWLKAHRTPKHPQPEAWRNACASSDPLLRKAMIKTMDSTGGVTWRFWARMVAGVLPTVIVQSWQTTL